MKKNAKYLGFIQLFVGIGAIPAGLSMILEPSGNGIGMTTEILINTPFDSFFIPGIFLFIVNGLSNILCSIISFRKNKLAGICGIILGTFLVLWIIIQIYLIGLIHFLQPLFFIIGIVEIILGYRYNTKRNKYDFIS